LNVPAPPRGRGGTFKVERSARPPGAPGGRDAAFNLERGTRVVNRVVKRETNRSGVLVDCAANN